MKPMVSFREKAPLRIPVKLVEGRWEFLYGGGVPTREGAVGDLILGADSIADKEFCARLKRRTEYKILDVGAELLVALTVKPDLNISPELKTALIVKKDDDLQFGTEYYSTARSAYTQFARVYVGEPSDQQKRMHPNKVGGAWLQLQGTRPTCVLTSQIVFPRLGGKGTFDSLNHAFTRLSEIYEPWRKAHTGNIYTRVLYKEKNGKWYPLDLLRDAAIAKDEHQIVRELWQEITRQMSLPL
jgi:hypothetical protein